MILYEFLPSTCIVLYYPQNINDKGGFQKSSFALYKKIQGQKRNFLISYRKIIISTIFWRGLSLFNALSTSELTDRVL
jgi:hypothetical protein